MLIYEFDILLFTIINQLVIINYVRVILDLIARIYILLKGGELSILF